jgi:hypothetical protein
LFSEAEWVFDGEKPLAGRQMVMEQLLRRVIMHPDGTPRTRHLSSNEDISVNEIAGTANCRRYVTVIQQTDELPLQVIYSGEYFDEFIRNDKGQWRYSRLSISRPFYSDLHNHIQPKG